jgi:DegV family protein with EDD domain
MPNIAIITDTDSSLPLDLAAQYHIDQVPIIIQFGEETFKDVFEMDNASCFALIDSAGKLPTTAAPAPGKFIEAYRKAFDNGAEQVICLTVSSEVSATYSAAVTARETMPDHDITVIDTLSLSMGQGFIVLAAAQAVAKGASKEEAIGRALDVRGRSHLYASLATLKYLAMSGRVGHLAAGIANVLNVKPILTIHDGKLDLLERVRTRLKAWDRTIHLAVEAAAGKPVTQAAIIHVNAPQEAHEFEQLLRKSLKYTQDMLIAEINPGLSIHSGPGMVGVVYIVEK